MNLTPITYKRKLSTKTLQYKFYPTSDLLDSKHFKHLKKVRCLAIDKDNRICMVANSKTSNWMLPGGTVEKTENPIFTLRRELLEEADVEIKSYKLLGFLEFYMHNNISNYDLRQDEMFFIAKIEKVNDQTADPDLGYILQRDFFSLDEFRDKLMNWGDISKYFAEELIKYKF